MSTPGASRTPASAAPWRLFTAQKFTAQDSPIQELKWAQDFIRLVDEATIATIPLPEDTRDRLRNPPAAPPPPDRDTLLSLRFFLRGLNAAETNYAGVREDFMNDDPTRELLSLHMIEKFLENLTGVVPLLNDMCPDSCCGFTGPFVDMEKCPFCHKDRYEWVVKMVNGHPKRERRACRVFYTIPLGPALQALFRSEEACKEMEYRGHATEKMKATVEAEGHIPVYTDYIDGSLYREFEHLGRIRPNDVVVVLSGDGVQLLKMKKSDCWIYVWIILDISPESRFKKRYILPGGFVPGPEHMKNTSSFLFPGLQHFNAISKDGLRVWKATSKSVVDTNPFLGFETADGVALAEMNGTTAHRGFMGCRLLCDHPGRRAEDSSQYYPACLRANGPTVANSDHDDIDPASLPEPSPEDYEARLTKLLTAKNPSQYKKLRRETGISAPTIFLGLARAFPFPLCLTPDTMHLHGLNLTSLFYGLWHGSLDGVHKNDDPKTWQWRVLIDDKWTLLGRWITDAKCYLPGSFDRAPRNIAEKFNSGYKTWEFTMLFYGLGPALHMDVLPDEYYDNYTKFVFAARRRDGRTVPVEDLLDAHSAQVEAHQQFEEIYYDRDPRRLNVCRQSIHNCTHGAPEIQRVGPLSLLSQYPLERTIGDLGRQIRNFQGEKMYTNFAHMGWRQTQINALYAIFPELAPKDTGISAKDVPLDDGYYLLSRGREKKRLPVTPSEAQAIRNWLEAHGVADSVILEADVVSVARWARIRLPTGQIVRALWKEQMAPNPRNIRMARNVRVSDADL
jgi:hypothetical protein